MLQTRQKMGSSLTAAKEATQSIKKDGVTLFRARFAGFSQKSAIEICDQMKKKNISCFAVK